MKNETLDIIKSLRSTHWTFSNRPVSSEDVETIIKHSLYPANNNDRTDTSVIVVDDPELLNAISFGESEGKSVTTLIYLLDYNRVIECSRFMGHNSYSPRDRFYHLLFGLYDVSTSVSAAVIAAKSMGIDSLVTNFTHRHDLNKIYKLLNLPGEYCFPVMQVALGYSDGEKPKPRNILTKGIIHYNQYKPAGKDDIQALIRNMDDNYPDRISEEHRHALDWFFGERWVNGYENEMFLNLIDMFLKTKLLNEPSLTGAKNKIHEGVLK